MQFSVVLDRPGQNNTSRTPRVISRRIQRSPHAIRTFYESFPDPLEKTRGRVFKRAALFLATLSAFITPGTIARAGQKATLAWNPDTNPSVVGYRLYYGAASRTYTNMVDVGNANGVTVSNLVGGTTYFFATTAYNILGLESIPSIEISYAPPVLLQLQISIATGTTVILRGTGVPSHTYEIQATTDLSTWSVIGTASAGSNGSFQFTNSGPGNLNRRFFRFRDTQP